MQKKIPQSGEFYRHFKGEVYQIIVIATHSESREQLVIYQAMYGEFQIYARPLSMFLSEIDRNKYPDAKGKWRFEKIEREHLNSEIEDGVNEREQLIAEFAGKDSNVVAENNDSVWENSSENFQIDTTSFSMNQDLLRFLDAASYTEKLEVLEQMKKRLDERILSDIEISLDLAAGVGTQEERLLLLQNNLQMLAKYENRRLR